MTWNQQKTQQRQPGALQFAGPGIVPYQLATANVAAAVQNRGRTFVAYFPDGATELRVATCGKRLNGLMIPGNLSQANTVLMSFELMNSAIASLPPILFGGVQSKTVTPGDGPVLSDDWCAVNGPVPPGTYLYWHHDDTVASAGIEMANQTYTDTIGAFMSANYYYAASGQVLNPITRPGILDSTGLAGGGAYLPVCIGPVLAKTPWRTTSVVGLGNSRLAGTALAAGERGNSRVSRALAAMNIKIWNMAIGNTQATQWGALTAAYFWPCAYADWFWLSDDVNGLTNGTTLAQMQSNQLAAIANARSVNPNIKIAMSKMEPHTTTATLSSISAITTSGKSFTMSVTDASLFPPGTRFTVSGYTGTALPYNGKWFAQSNDTTANTVTAIYPGTATGSAGTPIVTDGYTTAARQTPFSQAGPTGTIWSGYNDWIDSLYAAGTIQLVDNPNLDAESGGPGTSAVWAYDMTDDGLHRNDRGQSSGVARSAVDWQRQGLLPNPW